ncbi:MAG: TIGR00730 family Rossman fold protein [Gemmatimonadota bacterium]
MPTTLQRLCVYCASNDGVRPEYLAAARAFGHAVAERGIAVAYGGGRVGLMGALADAALDAGGEVVGVMPHALVEREAAHQGLTRLHVVDSMHTRKAMLADMSDAFVALPGGIGTLEEFFETFTWAGLGVHRKPVGLFDVAGFWQPLVALLDHLGAEGFLRGSPRAWLVMQDDAGRMIDALGSFDPPVVRQWVRPDET